MSDQTAKAPVEEINEDGTPKIIPPAEPAVVTPPKPEPPAVDYEQKFKESSREAQVLLAREKETKKKLEMLTSTNAPTEDELKSEFPNWEFLSDFEKESAKRTLHLQKRQNAKDLAELEREEARKWQEDFNNVLATNPKLQGLEAKFKEYAYMPTHIGVPLQTLVAAFLYNEAPAPVAPPTPPRPGLEPGTSGPKNDGPAPKLTADEIAAIRRTDPKKYNEMVKKGLLHPSKIA